ncbi:DUF4012 domain-containing protein [Candidatus Falkowbacteria bacterium]|jgi:hypothetical protein|nr:DUF4012 domain-containing protein [Candidatus Falkowbacteria bacterium]
MANRKIKFNHKGGFGNQVSGFVVDLRQKIKEETKQGQEIIADELTDAKKKAKRFFRKKIKRVKKLQPNLLKKKRGIIFPSFNFRGFNFKFRSPRKKWFSPKTSFWDKFLKEKSRLFEGVAKININSLKKRNAQRQRLKAAEAKVAWYRSILSFSLALILLIVPFKILSHFDIFNVNKLETQIINRSKSALNNLMAAVEAAGQMDFKLSASDFQSAGQDFISAQKKLNNISDSILFLASLSDNPKLKLATESKKFLAAGAFTSSLGNNLVLATDSLFSDNQENFSASLDQFIYYGTLASQDANNLKKELKKIKVKNLPEEYREKFIILSEQAISLGENLNNFVGLATKLKEALGATVDKRYLLVFQNNAELRASGGFLGSYALVDIRDGKVRNLEVPGGGSYDTEGGMTVRVVAPEPLWLVNPSWHFWDANWWPDWPTTAKNLMWFYEKSGGPTVDGVVALTPTIVERLLAITGPIDMTNEYGLLIDADNFWELVQKIVEQKNIMINHPTATEALVGIPATSTVLESALPLKQGLEVNSDNKPKKIIGDLMARIMEVLPTKLTKDNLIDILAMFESSLAEKQILFYFNDPNIQAEMVKHNWAGEIKEAEYDYLMVVNTNIAGQKSDRKMVEKIEHLSELMSDGSIINTVKITRTHTGIKNEPLTGVRNVDWLRVYVPEGSKLLLAEGFIKPAEEYFDEKPDPSWQENELVKNENKALIDEASGTKIYTENNKTVFANWLMVDPGESVTVTLKYRLAVNFLTEPTLNNRLEKINKFLNPAEEPLIPYSLIVQKQPGAKPSEFSSRLILPDSWSVFWASEKKYDKVNGWEIVDELNTDKYWSILIEK